MRKSAVAIFIDEIQYLIRKSCGALINGDAPGPAAPTPVVLSGACPSCPGWPGEPKSYAERLFSFPDVGALRRRMPRKQPGTPRRRRGRFRARRTRRGLPPDQGYPYFVQEWGYQAWNLAPSSPITKQIVQAATATVIPRLDRNFFRVRFDRLTPSEKNFLRAMADRPGPTAPATSPRRSG